MIVEEEKFEVDPEGLAYAAEVNLQLPTQVSVFSVQRVNKGFRARQMCHRRSYWYYLPMATLVPEGVEAGSEEEAQAVALFKQALSTYEGRHPYHNYTKRSQYRDGVRDSFKAKKRVKRARGGRPQVSSASSDGGIAISCTCSISG